MDRFVLGLALTLVASSSSASSSSADTLHLVCLGAGSASRASHAHAYLRDDQGNAAWGNFVASQDVPFDDQINIEMDGTAGTIRMPRAMLPPAHGGSAGWFRLADVAIGDDAIDASVQVNFMNHPKLHIDRLSGRITLSGRSGDYSGECRPYDMVTAQRRF